MTRLQLVALFILSAGPAAAQSAPEPAEAWWRHVTALADDSMRGRETGESSITALRSLYYAIKVTLALFVGIFRRRVVPLEEG